MYPTQFPELNNLVDDFVAHNRNILGDNLVGLYLQGSAAVGDMDVFSDVDFIVVTKRHPNEVELANLQKMHTDFFDRKDRNHWAEHLEGSYFPIDVLRAFDQPETKLIFNNNGSPTLAWDTHCNTLVVRHCLRKSGVALFGPPADTLFDPIPTDLFIDEVRTDMLEWGDMILARGHDMSRFYQQFIPISYCRALHTLETGEIYSKPAGVRWARHNLAVEWHDLFDQITAERDDSSVLSRQLAEEADIQRTLDFVTHACQRIEETRPCQIQSTDDMTNPTQFPDLNELIRDIVFSHQEILGDKMIGFYLQGSAAVGDMDEHSDLDFIVVTRSELNDMQMADLQKMHTDFFDRTAENQWAEHFEGSYFPIDILQAFDQPETKLVYIDNGSSTLEMNTHCNTLVVRWCLRELGITLVGPDPKTLLDPVPIDMMKDEIRTVMINWEGWIYDDMAMYSNRFYQPFIVLTYSRMLQTLATGKVYSKPAGAKWAVENLDPTWHDLITNAVKVRDDAAVNFYIPADPVELKRTLEFVTYVNRIAETFMSQEQTNV